MFRVTTPDTTVTVTNDGLVSMIDAYRLEWIADCDGYSVYRGDDGESWYVADAPVA